MMVIAGLKMGNTGMVVKDPSNIKCTSTKVARLLCDLVHDNGSAGQITVSKIAQTLDISPYAVNESLLLLRDADVIRLQRGRITIRNEERIN